MKLVLDGNETIQAPIEQLWVALNDPAVLTRCIPGCKAMTETAPDAYKVDLQLKVAAVGGSFAGDIALSDKEAPHRCRIQLSGGGTLGQGTGEASFELSPAPEGTVLSYQGSGEIGGLVAGVGQRILGSVSKNLVARFFQALRREVEAGQLGQVV